MHELTPQQNLQQSLRRAHREQWSVCWPSNQSSLGTQSAARQWSQERPVSQPQSTHGRTSTSRSSMARTVRPKQRTPPVVIAVKLPYSPMDLLEVRISWLHVPTDIVFVSSAPSSSSVVVAALSVGSLSSLSLSTQAAGCKAPPISRSGKAATGGLSS